MRTRTAVTALAAAGLLALTGCAAEDTDPGTTAPETSQADDAKKDDADTGEGAEAETATLPDLAGKGLQAAQDEAQAAGFFLLTSSDATGAGRLQAFDRNWKVCSQTPKAGEHPVDTKVEFDTVKVDENC
ncbi:hypothetical protein M4V62_35515 [Streptomyces durmitorensis]|uniref:PASTA domain-containing protein n=1 Tax=Streptomyces durmitorensis TaxID=319947 RepID=A0ABY4Q1J0_9ACTN|nr:hypothetical protein [Streptomyces durmitorensis]UQT59942.1 hypothetical protein M4V62_35515 [Streptomyces durmitorensis]